mgnify:CR=1 FL=1|jgi:hypothetical protein
MRRRDLLSGGVASLLLPGLFGSKAHAAGALQDSADERCFLFLYAEGGWDPAVTLTPMFDIPGAWVEEGSRLEYGGGDLPYVDHFSRPALGEFFRQYGAELALLHGMEVPSISHESCLRLLLTGQSQALDPDWPTQISGSPQDRPMPHLVIDGPAFAGNMSERVVRLGSEGQLPLLLKDRLADDLDNDKVDPQIQALIDASVAQRSASRADSSSYLAGHAQAHLESVQGLSLLQSQAQGLSLNQGYPGCTRDYETDFETLFTCFEAGLSRCGMIRHKGWCNQGWDTHQLHERQGINWEDMGEVLLELMAMRDRFPSVKERLVVVVVSEMGRHPRLNNWGGKDHWTWTSAMLFGDGVQPGVVGGLDEIGQGRNVDLSTGGSGSVRLGPQHLGDTLLSLSAGQVTGTPIQALLRS